MYKVVRQKVVHASHGHLSPYVTQLMNGERMRCAGGKTDSSIHRHLQEVTFETTSVLELRQKLLCTTPSGCWWWCIESVFRTGQRLSRTTWLALSKSQCPGASAEPLPRRKCKSFPPLSARQLISRKVDVRSP